MAEIKASRKQPRTAFLTKLGVPGTYLLVFAVCGWVILIANMFGLAGRAGWLFPAVSDIPGLAASAVLLALLGLTPLVIRQTFSGNRKDSSS